MSSKSIKQGDYVTVDMKELKVYSPIRSYHNIISSMLKKGNNRLYVYGISDDNRVAFVKINKDDKISDIEVPVSALKKDLLECYIENKINLILNEHMLSEYINNAVSVEDKEVFDYLKLKNNMYLTDIAVDLYKAFQNNKAGEAISGLPEYYLKQLKEALYKIKDKLTETWSNIYNLLSEKIN